MTANMYRVGDYVYFETSSTSPYQIRRIEELNKTSSGNVEAKVMCFYRRRDLPGALIQLADKHQMACSTHDESPVSVKLKKWLKTPANSNEDSSTVPTATQPFESSTLSALTGGGGTGTGTGGTLSTCSSSSSSALALNTAALDETHASSPGGQSSGSNGNGNGNNGNGTNNTQPLPINPACPITTNTPPANQPVPLVTATTPNTATAAVITNATIPAATTPLITTTTTTTNNININAAETTLNSKQRHQMKHRELFLSRQVETLPATHIRGKCSVTLFNETESLASYLGKEDMFFYSLVFDPTQKTLLADKGEIRVGSRYQCDITPLLKDVEMDDRNVSDLETLIWTPEHQLSDRQIDQFLVVSRSVGTFARALDCNSSVKQPSLHMSAAAASRDITLFHAMDTLHQHSYDLAAALGSLVPLGGPVLCRDEMEEWSASEANLFEEALDKYGKDFNDIRQDFLPWKTLKNIIEYYYMWKTTDRYVQQKRVKAVEAESKLKQVYIPNYNKPNPAALNNNKTVVNGNNTNSNNGEATVSLGGKSCESCNVSVSSQWYAWGPTHMQCRLCQACWHYWKRYGGLKIPTRIGDTDYDSNSGGQAGGGSAGATGNKRRAGSDVDDDRLSCAAPHRPHRCSIVNCGKEFKLKAHLGRHYATAHGIVVRSGSPRPIMKTRTAFYLCTTPLTRISRRLCRQLMRPRHAARSPFFPINIQSVKQECSLQMAGKSLLELKQLLIYNKKDRGSVTAIATRLGNPGSVVPAWLILTAKENLPKPDKVAFPKPPKAPDGSLMYERVPNKPDAEKISLNNLSSPSLKRRAYEELNGIDCAVISGPPAKRPTKDPMPLHRPTPDQYAAMMAAVAQGHGTLPRHISHLNGKPKIAHMTRTGSGRKPVISWMDAPDDVYFRATDGSKKMRRTISSVELRRAARKPWRPLPIKGNDDLQVVILD